MLEVQNFR